MRNRQWLLAVAVVLPLLAACTSTAGRPAARSGPAGEAAGPVAAASSAPAGLRAVRRVWLIDLGNRGFAHSFGTPSADPYLASALPRMGAVLTNYYAIGHSSAGPHGQHGTQACLRSPGHVVPRSHAARRRGRSVRRPP